MKENPEVLNLNQYRPFFHAVLGCDCALLLFNNTGKQLLKDYPGHSVRFDILLETINTQSLDLHCIASNKQIIALEEASLLVSNLRLGSNQETFYVAILINKQDSELEIKTKQIINQVLVDVCACLAKDYYTSMALHGMAEELAVRYEELNLLYGMDDLETYYNNCSEIEALTQLIENCTDYLNIDLALLAIPDQEISIQTSPRIDCSRKLDVIISVMHEKLYPFIQAHPESLVINRDADADCIDTRFNIPCKFIAVPILKTARKATGILILVSDVEKRDFTNSDCKLAEVLAAEAAKLIQARRDNITGLLNRRGFQEKLDRMITCLSRTGLQYCLLLIDIDQFKVVNDVAGQQAGDQLLNQVSALIKHEIHSNDVLARLGGDEFGVLLENYSVSDAMQAAEKIRMAIEHFQFFFDEKLFDVSVSIGLVWIDPETENSFDILGTADLACNMGKERGGNRIHVYESSDQETAAHEVQMGWVSKINRGLEEDRFLIYQQMIKGLQDQNSYEDHYEILVRLQDEDGEIISPFHFIPAAERYGLMSKLDRHVISKTLAKMFEIITQQPDAPLSCSINLSGQSFCEDGFIDFVVAEINNSGVPASRICFEITETAAVSNLSQTIEFMETLKQLGCKFSLDDFGSGMSSFTYLKNLPVDYLKIDGYFVKTMLENNIDHAMVSSINQIGHVMGLKTIAEFVENDALLAELKAMGIDYGQGYGIHKPEPFS